MSKPRFDADFTRAHNAAAYALGEKMKSGRFHVRRIVWGRLMARAERRQHEEIRRASISVATEQTR